VDLELSDEQRWVQESVDALLARADGGEALWRSLVDFGALSVGDDGLGAIELCLIARSLGAHLAPVPYLGSAALRYAAASSEAGLPDGFGALAGADAFSVAALEPGSGWALGAPATTIDAVVNGRKAGVEHAPEVQHLAVVASGADGPALALVAPDGGGVSIAEQPAFDPTTPLYGVVFDDAEPTAVAASTELIERLTAIGALLAAAEAVGAAGRLLDDACAYAGERRQFGRPISSFQALRHLLADMYVRQASSWSSVLYAAAALDEGAAEAQRTASIAKAYVSRAAREVAHGAIQVFGGIAITAEHPAHRFLRRIVVREQQFGDALHHERALGRALAAARAPEPVR
jgi:alkylation response protein AidB-like acyl-CoA dehydrogenase